MKKLLAFLLIFITIFFSSCSKEKTFGIQQFTERMNKAYNTNLQTSEFILGERDNETFLFLSKDSTLISLSLDSKNYIKSVSLLTFS